MSVVAARPVTPQGILAERLGDLARRAEAFGDTEFAADLDAAYALAAGLEPYVAAHTSPESPALAALAARTAAHAWADGLEQEMLSGHVEGRLLAFLVKATGAKRVLDIGMFTGYSALAMAEAGADVVALEIDPEAAAFADAAIDVRLGPATDTLRDLDGPFDLVFIDADKAGYLSYYEASLPLLAPDGLICVDNTLMQGHPWTGEPGLNGESIATFNAAIAADDRVEQVLVPVRDGLTLIRRA